jgi:hypothetical protein
MPTKGFKSELYLPHICTDFSNHTRYMVRMSFVEFWPLLHLCWLGAAGSSHIMLQQASQTIPRPGRPGIRVSIVTNADRFLRFSGNSLLTVGIYRKMHKLPGWWTIPNETNYRSLMRRMQSHRHQDLQLPCLGKIWEVQFCSSAVWTFCSSAGVFVCLCTHHWHHVFWVSFTLFLVSVFNFELDITMHRKEFLSWTLLRTYPSC